jgi:pimeloyl-ACP methyl ester carboxylesterase
VFVEDISVESIAKAKVAYETGDLRPRLEKHHGANVDLAFRGWNDAWLDPEFRKWNIEDGLAAVRAPVLVLQGEDDPYGTRAQVDAIARQISGPVTVAMIPNCGHAPHRDQPDEVIEKTRAFLSETGLLPSSS